MKNGNLKRLSHMYGLHCGGFDCEACAEMVRLKLCRHCTGEEA